MCQYTKKNKSFIMSWNDDETNGVQEGSNTYGDTITLISHIDYVKLSDQIIITTFITPSKGMSINDEITDEELVHSCLALYNNFLNQLGRIRDF